MENLTISPKQRLFKALFALLFLVLSSTAIPETYQKGDLAPRGVPDGALNAADLLILQQMVLGNIVPTDDEITIGDVAPLNNTDNVLNTGDLVVLQRAIMGEISLGTVDVTNLEAPAIDDADPPVIIQANSNPYEITGTATPGIDVNIYVNGELQHQITSELDGTFVQDVYLYDGLNSIHATVTDGTDESAASNIVQVEYESIIDKENLPTSITEDTVWTVGATQGPYQVPSRLYISSDAKLIIQPGVEVVFDGHYSLLDVSGELIIRGTETNKVLLTASDHSPGRGWDGIFVDDGAHININHAVIEYANSRRFWPNSIDGRLYRQSAVFFAPNSGGIISNTLIQFNRIGVELRGATSPVIGPNNTIMQNDTGLDLSALNNVNPTPLINQNKIFDNGGGTYNVDARGLAFTGTLNVRRNYWGSTNASEITATVTGGAHLPNPLIDISEFLDIDGNVVYTPNVLQGYISNNYALDANTVYEVRGRLEVETGASLTVPNGTILNFTNSAGITVYGDLIVQGTQFEPAIFTSGRDEPELLDWNSIDVKDGGSVNIDHAIVEYGARGISFNAGSDGVVSNTVVRYNLEGVKVSASSPVIGPGNIITQNSAGSGAGIYLESGAIDPQPIIKNNQIYNNTDAFGVTKNIDTSSFNEGRSGVVDVRQNYWGSTDSSEIVDTIARCTVNSSNPCIDFSQYQDEAGNIIPGNAILGVIDSDLTLNANTTYEVLGYLEISEGVTFTVPAGVVLEFVDYYSGVTVRGVFISDGTQINPVYLTSGQNAPVEGIRNHPGDWDGIDVYDFGSISLNYTVLQYADVGIGFYDSDAGGAITNSIVEKTGIGIEFYSNADKVTISNSLFRFNGTALDIVGLSSPLITSGNIIKNNYIGINLRQSSYENPSPLINGNYIFSNDSYNINVNNFIGGNTAIVDVRGNYWGSDDVAEIASKMNQSSTYFPAIDFSDFILTEDVPPGTTGGVATNEFLTCSVGQVIDDSDFSDRYPDADIPWTGADYVSVQEIEKSFNHARSIDNSIFQYLQMPSQEEWDLMSIQEQGLYLINSERQARGIKPYEGISPNVVSVAQNYADFLRVNNHPAGHYQDGKSPMIRLHEDVAIQDSYDSGAYLESLYSQAGAIPDTSDTQVVVDAIYRWIYVDKSGGNNWGHRDHIIQTGLYENSGKAYKEGLTGFGVSMGDYDPTNSLPGSVGAVVVFNSFDASSTWDTSTTQAVDVDTAQICNDSIVIHLDEALLTDIDKLERLEIAPDNILLATGGVAQIQVTGFYESPMVPRTLTSSVNFVADALSVVDINAGYITALNNGVVNVVVKANNVTSNTIRISVGRTTDTSNLAGTSAEPFADYIPSNATVIEYDPKALGVFTGKVLSKTGVGVPDVSIAVYGYEEYGSTMTDIDGEFTLATNAGGQRLVYSKPGYLTVHRKAFVRSNDWRVLDDVIMLPVDTAETEINVSSGAAQIHTSSVISDQFGTRSTTLVFNGITSATVTATNGAQRTLTDFTVRATEYELPASMPAELPKESAFTYCSELQIAGVRDDEIVTFDSDVIMYVDNFLDFGVGEIVPIGYYDRNLAEWVASDNGIVVRLLDTNGDGSIDGLDMTGDTTPDDLNQNGSTIDEVAGLENYTPGATYWRGSFNHFTPYDFNWPFIPPADAIGPGNVVAETGKEDKKQTELECTGSYVKPETQSFHEDIAIAGTDLTLHYSSQRTEGYKHKFNIKVSGDEIPASMQEMLVELEIGGKVYSDATPPEINKEIEFLWDGNDISGKRMKGAVRGVVRIGYKYPAQYVSAGTPNTPEEFANYINAWAKVGGVDATSGARDGFTTWSTSEITVQNTFDNQIAEGWSLSNNHFSNKNGTVFEGGGEVSEADKSSLILRTGIIASRYAGDDGSYQKGGSNIDYSITTQGTLIDKVTGLEWQYTQQPEKYSEILQAASYCNYASFTEDKEDWRLPTNKEVIYTVDKSGSSHPYQLYNMESIDRIWSTSNNNPEDKNLPVICVRGTDLDTKYETGLVRDNVKEVVIDKQNGLMWQDDSSATSVKRSWINALNYCESSEFSGYDDWRLPNINELAYALPNNVFQNQTVYPSNQPWGPTSPDRKPYWSSTPNPLNFIQWQAWAMESRGFSSPVFNGVDNYYVRCVRDNPEGISSPYRFDEHGKHTETVDLLTGKTLETLTYDESGMLEVITDRFGTELTITDISDPQSNDPQSPGGGFVAGDYRISTADGINTYITINEENEITDIAYDDNSKYTFTYTDGALLETKTEPNGNVFTHAFDPADGRVIQTSDQNGGVWDFFSSRTGNQGVLYGYTTAELNTYQTQRNILENGNTNKLTTLFDGTVLTDLNQANDLKQTLESCSVTTVIDSVIDSKTKQPIPSRITVTQPFGGLESITDISKTYAANGADFTKQTITTTLNGKSSTVFTDTRSGQTVLTSAEGRKTSLNSGTETLLLYSSQTPGLLDTVYTYDSRGRQETVTTGTRTTTFIYEPAGKGDVTTIRADDLRETHFEYDALGRVSAIVYPDGHRMENDYDGKGNLTQRIVPTPADHDFSYNKVNKVKTETRPKDGIVTETTQYSYDKERNLKQITLPSSDIISNTYTNGLLDFTTIPEGTIDYSYTCNEKVSSISEGSETINYSYNGSLLDDITYSGEINTTIDYGYNNDFNVTSLDYAGVTTTYGYDDDGLLTTITHGANGYTITRNALNGLPETLDNGTLNQTRSYNGYGEAETVTSNINNNTIYGYTLGYNDLGKITTKTETLDNGTVNTYLYTYDDRRRLETVTLNGIEIENYDYDANGNRTLQTNDLRGISNQSASYNIGDQLTSDGTTTYNYDTDGYLQSKTTGADVTTYSYDTLGRLKQVVTPANTITYRHNAMGNRVAKLVDGTVSEKYLWLDKTTLIATYDENDNLKQRFHYTDGNTPTSYTEAGQTYYIVTDHLGSPRAITDDSGTVLRKISYDSFGHIITDTDPAVEIPFGFAGGLYDKDTELVRFGYRDYDSKTGRWTARDPIGFSGGDANLYGYVLNDPVMFVDPTGEIAFPAVFGAIVGGLSAAISARNNPCFDGYDSDYFASVLSGSALGAISAMVSPASLYGTIKLGFVSGFYGSLTGSAIASGGNLRNADIRSAGVQGVVGAFSGGVGASYGIAVRGAGSSATAIHTGNIVGNTVSTSVNAVTNATIPVRYGGFN